MSQEVASRQLSPIEVFRKEVNARTAHFEAMLPGHVPVEKFQRVIVTAAANNPAILDLNRQSVLLSCARAAADGLLPDGREGAIVPFKGKAQWMPMTAGILKKIRNSGELLSINAYIVYQKDRFTYRLGDDEAIEHVPYLGEDPGPALAVYAVAKTKDGGVYREVMTKSQVEKVKAVSQSAGRADSPWQQWPDEMWRKTAIRRLSKRLPMSTDREEEVRAMLEREDDEPMQDVTPPANEVPRPTREQFQGSAAAGEAAPKGDTTPASEGGDNVTAGKSEAVTPAASDPRESMSPEERERVEREADRMQRQAEDDEGSAEATVDLSAVAIPMKGDKPDIAAYTAAVNAALAKVEAMTDLAEFDAANKPVATKIGGALMANYNLAVAQRRKAIGG